MKKKFDFIAIILARGGSKGIKFKNLIKIKKKQNFGLELNAIKSCARVAKSLGLEVHAGHGIDYKTVKILSKVKEIKEFNIGHFIIGESIFYGIKHTIKKFKRIMR